MTVGIGDALKWYATYTPDKAAIVDGDRQFDYASLWTRSRRLCQALSGLGLKSGDKIAVLMTNSHRYLELYQVAAMLGVAIVPLNFRLVAREIEYIVKHAEAKVLIFDDQFRALAEEARDTLRDVTSLFVVSDVDGYDDCLGYEGLIDAAEESFELPPVNWDASYFQGYTSGTTGAPKGCDNPYGSFVDQLKRMGALYEVRTEDRMLCPAPLFHEAPTLFALMQLMCGGTIVVTKDTSPDNILALIAAHRTTWTMMVPTMWATLGDSEALGTTDVSSMRMLVSGGSPLHSSTKNMLIKSFPTADLNEFYGGTEVGLVSNLGPEDQERKSRSVGKPVFGMHVVLLDEEGVPVAPGEAGEIYIGGGTLLREYVKNPGATASARHGDYITLGDMGRFDEEGFLYIVDRKKDMIISGGENIFPNDIEDVLNSHPGVRMCAVVGAPNPRWGEIVVAAVVKQPGAEVSEEDLIELCKNQLANFKVPKRIDFKSELPMSAFGKILRRDVREWNWADQEIKV